MFLFHSFQVKSKDQMRNWLQFIKKISTGHFFTRLVIFYAAYATGYRANSNISVLLARQDEVRNDMLVAMPPDVGAHDSLLLSSSNSFSATKSGEYAFQSSKRMPLTGY
jgi:hypothetical protein